MKRVFLLRIHRRLIAGAIAFACVLLLNPRVSAESSFGLEFKRVAIPEAGEITVSVVNVQGRRFSLLPPVDWRLGQHPAEYLVRFTASDYVSSLEIQFLNTVLHGGNDEQPARDLILRRFPNVELGESFEVYSGNGGVGVAFEFQRPVSAGVAPLKTRVAVIPCGNGCVLVALASDTSKWSKVLPVFNLLLNSLAPVEQ